ncbi:MAG: helix-turn-helix domain-containing protein [Actinomycetota bacterium]|nr:helix-turn-helix domain-containing protein [Actinomycetota bacterium]
MPRRQRSRLARTDEWTQLRLLVTEPAQETYELIRPVVLFGCSAVQRAQETGVAARTIARKALDFATSGMASLFPAPPSLSPRALPDEIRQAIRTLKAEHPAFRPNELATICFVRFGRRPSFHTVEKILADGPIPPVPARRFPPSTDVADPIQRRLAMIHLHAEGWNIQSIAAYLQTSRPTVYATLQRWAQDQFADLGDHSHTRKRVALKTNLKAIKEVRHLQENPELGEFRVRAALKQQLGIDLSARTCGRILALNRKLYGLSKPIARPRDPQAMPFKATRRHQYWTVDLRYLDMHNLDGGMIYVISILDNFSRVILASALSRTQDLGAFLLVLFAAVSAFGSPEALVSDAGSIFKAKEAMRIYAALGIQKEQIDKRQAWQSYIETTFNIQRRMADWHFANATTWKELHDSHDRWLTDYNEQEHWAHQKRADKRGSPREVLSFVKGTEWPLEELQRIFRVARGERRVKPNGYVRFRQWDLYSERGLAHQRVAVWLSADITTLTIEHAAEPLAQYTVTPEPDRTHLKDVALLHLFETSFPAPQLTLWEATAVEWRLALARPARAPRRQRELHKVMQLLLFPDDSIQTATG